MLRQALYIAKHDGLPNLMKRAIVFFSPYLFSNYTFHIYEDPVMHREEEEFLPRISGLEFYQVRSNREADQLVRDGYQDFRKEQLHAKRALDAGGIALCFYSHREIAHITWVVFSEKVQKVFFPVMYDVDFSHGQAFTGGTKTVQKYRGKGLMTYGVYKRLQFLHECGFTSASYVVNARYPAPVRAHARFDPVLCGSTRFIRVMGLRFRKTRWVQDPR